jgi:hypothetical protein
MGHKKSRFAAAFFIYFAASGAASGLVFGSLLPLWQV